MKRVKFLVSRLLFLTVVGTLLFGGFPQASKAEQVDASYAYTHVMQNTDWSNVAFPHDMALDASGNVYIAGYYYGTVNFDITGGVDSKTAPSQKGYLTRINADGTYNWTKEFPSTLESVSIDPGGRIVVAGTFSGTADFDPGLGVDSKASGGSVDPYASILNQDGSYNSTITFSNSGTEWLSKVKIGLDGSIFAGIQFSGTVDLDPGVGTANHTASGMHEMAIVKLNGDGSYDSSFSTAGTAGSSTWSSDLVIDSDGNIISTGRFTNTVDFDPGPTADSKTSAGGHDSYVTKILSDGSYGWTKTFGSAQNDYSSAVSVDQNNSVYSGGHFYNTVDFDPGAAADLKTSAGGTDAYITKLSSDGTYGWTKTYGSTSSDAVSSIAIDRGDVYIKGWFTGVVEFNPGVGVDNRGVSNVNDIYITKLTDDGNYISTYTTSSGLNSYVYGFDTMAINTTGDLYHADVSCCGTVDLNPFAAVDSHTSDYEYMFLTKINQVFLQQITGLPAGFQVVKTSDSVDATNDVVPRGEVTFITLSNQDDVPLAEIQVTLDSDSDWSSVTAGYDALAGKAFVHGITGLAGSADTFALYVPKLAGNNAVGICPSANSLAAVNASCAGIQYLILGQQNNLSVVSSGGVEYWKITGLTGTGGFSTTVNGLLAETGVSQITLALVASSIIGTVSLGYMIQRKRIS